MVAIDTVRDTTSGEPVLAVRGVSRGFARGAGEVRVLADVDLSLRSGQIVGLLGRSGLGKSMLLGLSPVSSSPATARWSIAAIL